MSTTSSCPYATDWFSIGVPDRAAIEALAARLDRLGAPHAEIERTPVGWVLPMLHDPDGHEVRFYTIATHDDERPEKGEQS